MSYYSESDDLDFTPLTREEEVTLLTACYAGIEPAATEARDRIVTNHLLAVAKMSVRAAAHRIPDDEAISAGNEALILLLHRKKFDVTRGVRFNTYLRSVVRGAVLKAVADRFKKAPADWRARLVPEQHPSDDREGLLGILDPVVEDNDLAAERKKILHRKIKRLKGLERKAVYGVGIKGRTLEFIARQSGVSRQAVHQAYHRGLAKLKKYLRNEKPELL